MKKHNTRCVNKNSLKNLVAFNYKQPATEQTSVPQTTPIKRIAFHRAMNQNWYFRNVLNVFIPKSMRLLSPLHNFTINGNYILHIAGPTPLRYLVS
jgi:hypothetical protein